MPAGIELKGDFGARVLITPQLIDEPLTTKLITVEDSTFADEVILGDHVFVGDCNFYSCPDLDRIRLYGSSHFRDGEIDLPEPKPPWSPHIESVVTEMVAVYRRLRIGAEEQNNRRLADRLYRAEMRTRLELARAGGAVVERTLLLAYRPMSYYSTSVLRTPMWFVGVAVAGAALFRVGGLSVNTTSSATGIAQYFTFACRSMVSFLSPPDAGPGLLNQWTQLSLRFIGPTLLAQAVLAVRSRVVR